MCVCVCVCVETEFKQFGVGVSNYFKTVKWLGWMFFTLSILAMPMLVINTFGTNMVFSFTQIR